MLAFCFRENALPVIDFYIRLCVWLNFQAFSPFRALSEQEDADLVEMINSLQPDFLWVGLGAPKQEKWIAAHLARVNVPAQIDVGAAFDFHSGHVKRSPVWMQKIGMEWVYRMLQDRRLIKRYLMTNPVFLALFLRDFINAKIRG